MKSIRLSWRKVTDDEWVLKPVYADVVLGVAVRIGSTWTGTTALKVQKNCPSCSSAERWVEQSLGVKKQADWPIEDCGGGCIGEHMGTCILGDRQFTNEEREAWPALPRWCPLRERPIVLHRSR